MEAPFARSLGWVAQWFDIDPIYHHQKNTTSWCERWMNKTHLYRNIYIYKYINIWKIQNGNVSSLRNCNNGRFHCTWLPILRLTLDSLGPKRHAVHNQPEMHCSKWRPGPEMIQTHHILIISSQNPNTFFILGAMPNPMIWPVEGAHQP